MKGLAQSLKLTIFARETMPLMPQKPINPAAMFRLGMIPTVKPSFKTCEERELLLKVLYFRLAIISLTQVRMILIRRSHFHNMLRLVDLQDLQPIKGFTLENHL